MYLEFFRGFRFLTLTDFHRLCVTGIFHSIWLNDKIDGLIDSTWNETFSICFVQSVASLKRNWEKKKKNTIGGNVTEFKISSYVFHSLYRSYFALAHPPLGRMTHEAH